MGKRGLTGPHFRTLEAVACLLHCAQPKRGSWTGLQAGDEQQLWWYPGTFVPSQTRDESPLDACLMMAWVLICPPPLPGWGPPHGQKQVYSFSGLPPPSIPRSLVHTWRSRDPGESITTLPTRGPSRPGVRTELHVHHPNITFHWGTLRLRAAQQGNYSRLNRVGGQVGVGMGHDRHLLNT